MGFLQDRKILVTGLLSNRSIAYGIAKALAREGATLAFTYQSEELRERVEELAQAFGRAPVLPCDVAKDAGDRGRCSPSWAGSGAAWTASCTRSRSRRARR